MEIIWLWPSTAWVGSQGQGRDSYRTLPVRAGRKNHQTVPVMRISHMAPATAETWHHWVKVWMPWGFSKLFHGQPFCRIDLQGFSCRIFENYIRNHTNSKARAYIRPPVTRDEERSISGHWHQECKADALMPKTTVLKSQMLSIWNRKHWPNAVVANAHWRLVLPREISNADVVSQLYLWVSGCIPWLRRGVRTLWVPQTPNDLLIHTLCA
jgi:hypothetical protein